MRVWVRLLVLSVFAVFFAAGSNYGAPGPKLTGAGNKHNLSSSGTGAYKATNTSDPRSSQVCVFCHTPHNARPQTVLWNRNDTTQTFGHYSSQTLKLHTDSTTRTASDYKNEPSGSSRLCLSCHDGVTALGAVIVGGPIEINSSTTTKMAGSHVFDRTKITNSHHPVSFIYNSIVRDRLNTLEGAGTYRLPSDIPAVAEVRLDKERRMQCTTCHDPHQTQFADALTPFWVMPGANATDAHDKVCTACHTFATPDL